ALLVFTLFIQLTIASCKEEIRLLITLGAAPKQLQQFLMRHFFPINIFIIVIALIILSAIQYVAANAISAQHIYINHFISPFTIIAALVMLVVLWLVNRQGVRKYLGFGDVRFRI
ncbi:MAG: FtsX-like permease family protein, partial [Bacteroidota bacterium]